MFKKVFLLASAAFLFENAAYGAETQLKTLKQDLHNHQQKFGPKPHDEFQQVIRQSLIEEIQKLEQEIKKSQQVQVESRPSETLENLEKQLDYHRDVFGEFPEEREEQAVRQSLIDQINKLKKQQPIKPKQSLGIKKPLGSIHNNPTSSFSQQINKKTAPSSEQGSSVQLELKKLNFTQPQIQRFLEFRQPETEENLAIYNRMLELLQNIKTEVKTNKNPKIVNILQRILGQGKKSGLNPQLQQPLSKDKIKEINGKKFYQFKVSGLGDYCGLRAFMVLFSEFENFIKNNLNTQYKLVVYNALGNHHAEFDQNEEALSTILNNFGWTSNPVKHLQEVIKKSPNLDATFFPVLAEISGRRFTVYADNNDGIPYLNIPKWLPSHQGDDTTLHIYNPNVGHYDLLVEVGGKDKALGRAILAHLTNEDFINQGHIESKGFPHITTPTALQEFMDLENAVKEELLQANHHHNNEENDQEVQMRSQFFIDEFDN
jgi:hypothetical protein